MKKASEFLVVVCLLLLGTAFVYALAVQGNGPVTSETRAIPSFSRLTLHGAMDVTWAIGQPHVVVTAERNSIPEILTEVSGDVLTIAAPTSSSALENIRVTIFGPPLTEAAVDGAARLFIRDLKGLTIALRVDGVGEIEATGEVGSVVASVSGNGRLEADDLRAKSCSIDLQGVARAYVFASKTLELDVASASRLTYFGNPHVTIRNSATLGKIVHG
jgi:hypothetical protein